MPVLTPQQRNSLETAVKLARRMAEQGALNALQAMAVNHPEPFSHMNTVQRSLRNNLRSKARLLGDELKSNGIQSMAHLSYELAYETWHKMLFAKFLEANNLLMHTEGVAVTMEDCEELAKEEGYIDKWDAAANYAGKMLPAIFRTDDPLMQVSFSTDERIKLESIIDSLDNVIFTADDALGWVYQFWQSDAKKNVEEEEKSGQKIDGERLPAKTQLFTEPYMVNFLIDNTLGAWWVSRNPGIKPPVKFEYLRMNPVNEPVEVPATGSFPGWPDRTADITSLDPCMGSGHFVCSLFKVFAALRMYEEGLTKEQATVRVIAENLHGLEIDPRCTQIAAFNLALTAWKFCGHFNELPEMNLACSGIAPKGKMEDWVKLVQNEKDPLQRERYEAGIMALYDHFQLAPELGSLLDPGSIPANYLRAGFEELQPVLKKALENEPDTEQLERGVMAAGIAKAGQLLSRKYTLQITNVPYIKKGKLGNLITRYIETNFPTSKEALETVFIERMLICSAVGGVACSVIPQNWLFLTSYRNFREKLLKTITWNFVARLGPKAFQTPMWDFNVMLIILQNIKPLESNSISGLDVSTKSNALAKDEAIKKTLIKSIIQNEQLLNPDGRIILEEEKNTSPLLDKKAESGGGASSFDSPRFMQTFWENAILDPEIFMLCQSSPNTDAIFTGRSNTFKWENGKGGLYELMRQKKELENYSSGIWSVWSRFVEKKGVCVGMMGDITVSPYEGKAFDNNTGVIIPFDQNDLIAVWTYCSSIEYRDELRKLDQKLNVTSGTLVKVPFDLDHWQKIAAEKYPNGLPKPYSDDPTQWLFHGHPVKTFNPLQVALTRVLGYRWPSENDTEMELAEEARELIEAIKDFNHLSDEDGIFCIPSVNSEHAGAERLRDFLQQVFANEWNSQTITQLLQKEGVKAANLEIWLRDEFFVQHCKVFQNRPFIWQIWDGRKDGFSALVNYHKLTKDNLSKLIYTYLGDWIRMCEAKKKAGESGAEGLLSAALKLKEKLEAILQGEDPFDIFIRWKPLEQQPIGWDPDLNDGVRLNIRPFVEAGILRNKFNIKWGIDRGKNPPNSPWGEIRDNDRHLSLADKREARENI
ncbi:MAG: hypothetical protein FD155_3233 [Bacteroidetes bacterium]|nr:MAG: hypothetical protein FD155_3233 [Bacteroidota bacterium]